MREADGRSDGDTLAEWFTYIPSKIDYSDIMSIMKL